VWSGEKMLVWAGMPVNFDAPSPGGGRYAPDTDSWEPIADAGTIPGRMQPAGVWTGSEMLVWGGHDRELHTGREAVGGSYDPQADTWTQLGMEGLPLGRGSFAWSWSGEELLVWGGVTSQIVGTGILGEGARYSPEARHWTAMSDQGAPTPRFGSSAVWTGKLFIVWGGNGSANATRTGAAYDPAQDLWTPVPTATDLPAMRLHTAVWTGTEMIVWNGHGAAYNPDTGAWRIISDQHGLRERTLHTAIWTGSRMIIFGGRALGSGASLNDGASYDPVSDSWSVLETCNAPSPRWEHSAVWTGRSMMIWGGRASSNVVLSDGAIYVPAEFRSEL
jgi:N-acetylneuraminic acid mutarotase